MILDTCALLFLASGDKRLSPQTRELLSGAPIRWFCAISAFEIAIKVAAKKLQLPLTPEAWISRMTEDYALSEIALDSSLCLASVALPMLHRDPCDRFIIAAARQLRVPVVTIDPRFESYGVEILQ